MRLLRQPGGFESAVPIEEALSANCEWEVRDGKLARCENKVDQEARARGWSSANGAGRNERSRRRARRERRVRHREMCAFGTRRHDRGILRCYVRRRLEEFPRNRAPAAATLISPHGGAWLVGCSLPHQ